MPHHLQFGIRLLNRNPRPEAPHHAEHVVRVFRLCVSLNIIESGMVMSGSRPGAGALEMRGRDADDREQLVLKGERFPESRGVEAEAPLANTGS